MPSLRLQDSNNWDLLWQNQAVGPPTGKGDGSYFPIPEIEVPFLIENPIVAVASSASNVNPTWRFAARMEQRIQLGLLVGTNPTVVARRRVWLNRVSLYFLNSSASSYSLAFKIPYWFSSMTLTLWVYNGPKPEGSETVLERIEQTLSRIEAKI